MSLAAYYYYLISQSLVGEARRQCFISGTINVRVHRYDNIVSNMFGSYSTITYYPQFTPFLSFSLIAAVLRK